MSLVTLLTVAPVLVTVHAPLFEITTILSNTVLYVFDPVPELGRTVKLNLVPESIEKLADDPVNEYCFD